MSDRLRNEVTLVCVDCVDTGRAIASLERSKTQVRFKNVKLLTSLEVGYEHRVGIRQIVGVEDYSRFCVHELWRYVDTSHCLVTQHDGWVADGGAWDDAWLSYDYVGTLAWFTGADGKAGNGGFSLRSRRMLERAGDVIGDSCHPEDVAFSASAPVNGHTNGRRARFEALGFTFAPRYVQERFGFDSRPWSKGQFGHHRGAQ